MNLAPQLKDFEYTVHDSRGIMGVKDGVKYPISKEDWKKSHPEHRNTECKECTFVLDTASILSFHIPKEVRDNANRKPKFIGKFTMSGWAGHSGFYLFRCVDCNHICVDYPHGYRNNGCLYIRCNHCGYEIVLAPKKYRDIYRRDGVVAPPTLWETMKGIWALRKIKNLKWFRGSEDDLRALRKPLNIENQEELKVKGRVPTDLES